MDHICDSHEECYHDPLGDLERRKKWFIPGKRYILMYLPVAKLSSLYTQALKHVKSSMMSFATKLYWLISSNYRLFNKPVV